MVSRRWVGFVSLGVAVLCAWAGSVDAQPPYIRNLTGFEGFEVGEATGSVIWRDPLISGSTVRYDQGDPPGSSDIEPDGIYGYDPPEDYPWSLSQVADYLDQNSQPSAYAGSQMYEIYFDWGNPADTDYDNALYPNDPNPRDTGTNDLVRCTTLGANFFDRPSVHLGGKIKFRLSAVAYDCDDFANTCPNPIAASILLVAGVRETGHNQLQGETDAAPGDIEWVYPDGALADGIVPPNTNGPLPEPAYPGGLRIYTIDHWPPNHADNNDWQEVVIDLGSPEALRGFANDSIAPDTAGDGSLDATGVGDGVNRGAFENISFTNDPDETTGKFFFIYIDEVTLESPEADPVLPPTVVFPIIEGDPTVTVTDLVPTVDRVSLYVDTNGGPELVEEKTVASDADVVFTLPSPAETGDVYTATQRSSESGTPVTSAQSAGVTVLPYPPLYTFSILLDEGGTGSCDYTTGGWEWVGVTSVDSSDGKWEPHGTAPLFPNDGVWQTVDIPLNNNDVVIANYGGNGRLEPPAPNGVYTIDSIWFSREEASTNGPWVVFVDGVQLIDSNGEPGEIILNMEDGVNRLQNARGQSPDELGLNSSALSTLASYDGTRSHRIEWEYDGAPLESIGMLQRLSLTCGTSQLIDDSSLGIRFHLLCRSQPTSGLPLPQVVGPIIVGNQDTVRVTTIDPSATEIQLYIDGVPEGDPINTSGVQFVDIEGLTLEPGQSISATQTIGMVESDLAYPRGVNAAPLPPTVQEGLIPGATSVPVSGLSTAAHATTSLVKVYVNDGFAGSAAGGAATVNVTVPELDAFDVVTAQQIVNAATSGFSDPVTVLVPAPVIYKAPKEGESTVRVLDLLPNATHVTVTVDDGVGGTNGFTEEVDPGAGEWEVTVSALVAGYTVTASQTASGVQGVETPPETVTVNTATTLVCDDFESYANQTAMDAVWTQHTTLVELRDDKNATIGGEQSAFAPVAPGGQGYMTHAITQTVPTAMNPVVVNANIYDPVGTGSAVVNWIELNAEGGPDYFYMHVGMGWPDVSTSYYCFRAVSNGGPNWVSLDQYEAEPRSVGWHTFTVVHKGNLIDVYVDKLLARKNIALTAETTYARADIGGGYSYYGTEGTWFDDYCAEVGPVRFLELEEQPPPPPTVRSPIVDGDEVVTLSGIEDQVTEVAVYDESDIVIGTAGGNPVSTNGFVDVSLTRPLVHLERITATQTDAVGESGHSAALEVGKGNGDVRICIGVTDGSGRIEWIGASVDSNGAPQGVEFVPTNGWKTLTFDPTSDPVHGFTGDGVIDGTYGSLEHLAVSVNAGSANRSTGVYNLYVDNVVNVGAGSGDTDVVITNFDAFNVGDEVLFQEPTYSGSTYPADLSYPPSASQVTDTQGNGGKSAWLRWFWKDTDEQRWARITTSGADNIPSPSINLTKPIRLDILLRAGCTTTPGDVDGDGDVDVDDVDNFAACVTGPGGALSLGCECADLTGDGDADLADYAELQLLAP